MPEPARPRLAGPTRPLGDPDIPQFHLPTASAGPGEGAYAPRLYGCATVVFADKKRGVNESRRVAFVVPLESSVRAIDWETARPVPFTAQQLAVQPPVRANYLPLPAGAMRVPTFTRWAKSFDRWLARTQRLVLAPTSSASEAAEPVSLRPKRGGVNVELVAIVWELA